MISIDTIWEGYVSQFRKMKEPTEVKEIGEVDWSDVFQEDLDNDTFTPYL